jgi:hypothetical protein
LPPLDDTETQVGAPDDIRSALMAAIDGAETAPEAPETPTPETETDKPTRARGPDGKFAAKEESQTETPTPETPKEEAKAPEGKATTTEPPANWSEADKAKFKTLPADGQEFLLRRHTAMEADYTKKTTEIAAFRKEYEPVAQIFAPHLDALRQSGFTPASLVKAWADVETSLMGGRGVDVVKDIVRQYKIDPQQVARALGLSVAAPAAGTVQPPAPDAPVTPQLPPEIAAKLQGYDQFIAQQQQERAQQAAAQQREAEHRVMSAIDQFSSAKDDAGGLKHPHFAEVEADMTRLMVAARTSGETVSTDRLADFYDQAVWANPSTRAKALEATRAAEQAQHAAAEAERAKEARAKAERARRAGSSVTGSPGTGQSPTQAPKGADSIRAALLAAAEEHEAA